MFRFTIRDLVLLTVIVGLGVGWAADHSLKARKEDALRFGLQCAIDAYSFQLNQKVGVRLPDGEMVFSKQVGPWADTGC